MGTNPVAEGFVQREGHLRTPSTGTWGLQTDLPPGGTHHDTQWLAPSLNETVPHDYSTISFPELRDMAAVTLVTYTFSLLDWKGAFRQLSLAPSQWRYTWYIIATIHIVIQGRLRKVWLIIIEGRPFFGGAAATSSFANMPIAHCRALEFKEQEHHARSRASPRGRAKPWRWTYNIPRLHPRRGHSGALLRGTRMTDLGLAPVPPRLLPKPRPKVKQNRILHPVTPECSQALRFFRAFRLDKPLGAFMQYVDDIGFMGGSNSLRNHRKDFDNIQAEGADQSHIDYKHEEGPHPLAAKTFNASQTKPTVFGGRALYCLPEAAVGLPEDKRQELLGYLEIALKTHPGPCPVKFVILESLLGKLAWWASIDATVWCYLAPLQWLLVSLAEIFRLRETDPREIMCPKIPREVRQTLETLRGSLKRKETRIPSIRLVWLPLFDGCLVFVTDAAGSHDQGIGLVLLGQLPCMKDGLSQAFRGGGIIAHDTYPTPFEKNLRQTSKEMLGALLGVLLWAPLAQKLGIPIVLFTDNLGVLSACQKCRSASYNVWRIYKAIMDTLRPLGIRLFAHWMSTDIIPADPLSRTQQSPDTWRRELEARSALLSIKPHHTELKKLPWHQARTLVGVHEVFLRPILK